MLHRNDRVSVLNAVFGAMAVNMINPYIGILAVKMGADNLQLGYLSSWPNAASVVAVLGTAAAVARSEKKQRLIAAILLAGRAAALGVAAVPSVPQELRVWALIGFWVLAVFPGAAAGTAMQSFLADVFPQNDRGRAFASRQSWATGAGMIAAFGSGWMLDNYLPYPLGYQIMFTGSFLAALVEIYFFLRLKEHPVALREQIPATVPERVGFATYLQSLRYRPFAQFVLVSLLFHFTWQMAWPIFTRLQVTELRADNTWLSLIQVANSFVAIATYPLWARAGLRFGNGKVLALACLWLSAAPFLSSMAPNIQWLVAINAFTGIGNAGVVLLILNSLLDVAPVQGRPVYLAVHAALVSISAAVAPMAGAVLMDLLPARTGLALCSVPRLLSSLLFVYLYYRSARGKGNPLGVEKRAREHLAQREGVSS